MAINVMLDLETLGTRPGSIILSIGAVPFGPGAPDAQYHRVINARSALNAGLVDDQNTVLWWEKQSDEAKKTYKEAIGTGSTPIGIVLFDFGNWLQGLGNIDEPIHVWGNGAAFDNALLAEAYLRCGLLCPWKHTHDRCYRTLKGLRPDIPLTRIGEHHNALDDARSQAVHATTIMTELELWG